MKVIVYSRKGKILFLCAAIFLYIGVAYPINGQEVTVPLVPVPPAKESFLPSQGLMVPWRSGGCFMMGRINRIDGCYLVTSKEYVASSVLSIYNDNGTLWYRFDVQPARSGYFWTRSDVDLVPYSTGISQYVEGPDYPDMVILRITAESSHWIEVIASEKTLLKKYIDKKDPLWKITTWDHWLADGLNLYLPHKHEPLRDAPNGEVISESADLQFQRVKFVKTDGDWAYVSGRELSDGRLISAHFGWVKWREDSRLLVGCLLNNFVVPK